MSSVGPSSVAESSAMPFFFLPPPLDLAADFAFSSALAFVTPLALSFFSSLRCLSYAFSWKGVQVGCVTTRLPSWKQEKKKSGSGHEDEPREGRNARAPCASACTSS